jgi:phosphatidylinositol glycan class N
VNQGTFGVSHTRVPTESRPGHVALIAGLYEDVSAVATGWKLNPVNFDSVFNRSRHTWSWGSPDILPMFERGAVPGRVDAYMYSPEFEDFSKDAVHLDEWVFDHVRDFFAEAATNQTLNRALRQDKVVFFLHLLGLDTTGHSYRPYSKEYLHNLKVVDKGVKEVTNIINEFYADDRTAFVFTADHGMSDWGSHGDGHPDNTRTPLITWGSGVARPEVHPDAVAPGHDDYSADWALNHVRRHDVAQADVAALMAHLVGVEFPANSVGRLPLSYLAADDKEKAEASLVNAQEILEMYRVKEQKKQAVQLRFVPYHPLSEKSTLPDQRIADIRQLIESGKYEEAIEETDALIGITLEGLRYLQTYDWLFLRALITIGYLGWIMYALSTVINMYVVQESIPPKRTAAGIVLFSSVLVALYSYFIVSSSPPQYYVYAFFPVMFWEEVYARRQSLAEGRRLLFGQIQSTGAVLGLLLHAVAYIAVIQTLVSITSSPFDPLLTILGTGLYPSRAIDRSICSWIPLARCIWPIIPSYTSAPVLYMVCLMLGYEHIHSLACHEGGGRKLDVCGYPYLSVHLKLLLILFSVLGGILMVALGVLYLAFEDFVLADFSWSAKKSPIKSTRGVGRILTGAQVGQPQPYRRTAF